MKVLYVFHSLAIWGGIERILVDKMNHLKTDFGYDVGILTTDQGSHAIPYQLTDGIYVKDLGISFHLQYKHKGLRKLWERIKLAHRCELRMKEQIETFQPDVIVCVATSMADIAIKVSGKIPVVVESHSDFNHTFFGQKLIQRCRSWRLKRCLNQAQVIVALTEGDASEWRKHYKNIKVIPNMVNLNQGSISQQNSNHVIFVGRFDYQKLPTEAIEIWKLIQPDFPDWTLDIYGEGEEQEKVEQAALASGLKICIHKPTARIFDCYRESTILMMTSQFEPFGLVLPEAMSCGLPVVAYDCPYGPASIISQGVDGFLIKNNDREAFAQQMKQLMADRELRLSVGKKAAESAKRFDARRIMPQWKELFEKLCH